MVVHQQKVTLQHLCNFSVTSKYFRILCAEFMLPVIVALKTLTTCQCMMLELPSWAQSFSSTKSNRWESLSSWKNRLSLLELIQLLLQPQTTMETTRSLLRLAGKSPDVLPLSQQQFEQSSYRDGWLHLNTNQSFSTNDTNTATVIFWFHIIS